MWARVKSSFTSMRFCMSFGFSSPFKEIDYLYRPVSILSVIFSANDGVCIYLKSELLQEHYKKLI